MIRFLAGAGRWFRDRAVDLKRWTTSWFDRPYRTIDVEGELPPKLQARTLYVVSEDGYEEQVVMLCPCGRRHILQMNLLPDERPLWHVIRHDDGTASLRPSVWRKKDCRSHFWFRRGRVVWVPPTTYS